MARGKTLRRSCKLDLGSSGYMIPVRDVWQSIRILDGWIKKQNYAGYDPYDALSSPLLKKLSLNSKWLRTLLTHGLKQLPLNLRPLLRIAKNRNTTAIAVITASYIKLFKLTEDPSYLEKALVLLNWLEDHSNSHYTGLGWGRNDYGFQSSSEYMPRFQPLTFITALVANVFVDAYEATGDREHLDKARRACHFILNESNVYENDKGICFSYTIYGNSRIFNATMLAGSCMARVYHYVGEHLLLKAAKRTVDYVVSEQNSDGSWYYGYRNDGKVRKQIDFHQGYVLRSLYDFIEYVRPEECKYMDALFNGVSFYKREQFLPDGRAKWRWPKVWPIDIHNQAEGILTFSKLSKLGPVYLDFADRIAKWSIENMRSSAGYFYYQKRRFYTNKIPYMRWSEAWMFKALVYLAEALDGGFTEFEAPFPSSMRERV